MLARKTVCCGNSLFLSLYFLSLFCVILHFFIFFLRLYQCPFFLSRGYGSVWVPLGEDEMGAASLRNWWFYLSFHVAKNPGHDIIQGSFLKVALVYGIVWLIQSLEWFESSVIFVWGLWKFWFWAVLRVEVVSVESNGVVETRMDKYIHTLTYIRTYTRTYILHTNKYRDSQTGRTIARNQIDFKHQRRVLFFMFFMLPCLCTHICDK